MGQDWSTCKPCIDQEEVLEEFRISEKPLLPKKAGGMTNNKIHKASQKATSHTLSKAQANNHPQTCQTQYKSQNKKYQRKSSLDLIEFNSKKIWIWRRTLPFNKFYSWK